MSVNLQELLDTFHHGDFDERLTLFLNYRELRGLFSEIESRELDLTYVR